MPKTRQRARERARLLFLSGDAETNAEIARKLQVKPHTVASWRKQESWDELKLKADRRAAEKLVETIATDRAELNSKHFKLWDALLGRALGLLRTGSADTIGGVERVASILERAQRGQRIAKEIATAAEAADHARLQAEADIRFMVDLFVSVVKEHVPDETLRDKIRTAVLAGLPSEEGDGAGEPGDASVS